MVAMPNPQTISPDDPALRRCKLLTAAQVGELLQVDRSTVWRLTQRIENPLPCIRFGARNTRFSLSDLEKFIAQAGVKK